MVAVSPCKAARNDPWLADEEHLISDSHGLTWTFLLDGSISLAEEHEPREEEEDNRALEKAPGYS